MAESLTIGRLAASGGVHVETVRYYQRRGLLPEPERPPGGTRRYGDADLSRLQFIRRAQAMGFSLDEIAELLKLQGQRACARTQALTEHKLVDVRQRLQELRRLEQDLVQLIAKCANADSAGFCPTLDQLEQSGGMPSRERPTPLQSQQPARRAPRRSAPQT